MNRRVKHAIGLSKIALGAMIAALFCNSTSQIVPLQAQETKSASSGKITRSGDILKVRVGGSRTQTRLVIDLAKPTRGIGDSDRLEDTDEVELRLGEVNMKSAVTGAGVGLVKDWRIEPSLFPGSKSVKLKLTLNNNAHIARRFLLPPADGIEHYRYVIDITPKSITNETLNERILKPQDVPLKASNGDYSVASNDRKTIVIDAGHGGKDPGASGAQSIEKHINLAAARALKDQLEQTGRYRVIMTRDTDSFVDLSARVRIARNANADLFISLHSDSGPNNHLRGASIYTLSDQGTERAARKALVRGDWTQSHAAVQTSGDIMVNRILIDLTQRATKNRSATFAQILLNRLDGTMPLLQSGHRQAGFAVLLATDVPAVLLEMGFITNADDEKVLTDANRRTQMMKKVASAIDGYFEQDKRTTSFAALP